LFFEQDHLDPKAVVPVFYSFSDHITDRWDFAQKYVENFLRWYAAFRLREPRIVLGRQVKRDQLLDMIRQKMSMTEGFEGTIELLEGIVEKQVIMPEQWALCHPRRVSDYDDSTIVVFLDEFQNTRLPQFDFDVVGYMQEAVESPTCPHFVTGSAKYSCQRDFGARCVIWPF
jgi:hypothetical protein